MSSTLGPTDPTVFFKNAKADELTKIADLERQISVIEKEAAHKVMPLKWDLAAAKSKIKKLDKEIEGAK